MGFPRDSIRVVFHRHESGEEIDLDTTEVIVRYGVGETTVSVVCLRWSEEPDIIPGYEDTLYLIRDGQREGPYDLSSWERKQNLENDEKPLEYHIKGWMWYFHIESENRELAGQGASQQ